MLWHGKNFRGFLNKASQVLFNKTGTTLQSDNVEDAIKEINNNLLAYKMGSRFRVTVDMTQSIGEHSINITIPTISGYRFEGAIGTSNTTRLLFMGILNNGESAYYKIISSGATTADLIITPFYSRQ